MIHYPSDPDEGESRICWRCGERVFPERSITGGGVTYIITCSQRECTNMMLVRDETIYKVLKKWDELVTFYRGEI